MKVDKHTIFSIILLLFFFTAGFVASFHFTGSAVWECPVCSFDSAQITPVINNQYFDILYKEITSAGESIEVIMYEMKFYETNNSVRQLEDALIAAQRRGVEVRVILDQNEWSGRITSATKENWKTKEYLVENNVAVKLDSLKKTTHNKIIIIDGKTVLIGSTNWSFSALERNNEANALIRDEATAKYFLNYFDFLWEQS